MTHAPAIESMEPTAFRRVMGAFATGVAVLTTELDGELHGITVNSLTSVSLIPCTILVCLRTGSSTGAAVRRRGSFGLNILSCGQMSLSRKFCGPVEERFRDVNLLSDDEGIPLIAGALAHMRCRLQDVRASGDHEVFFGEVERCGLIDDQPLVFHRGRFGTFAGEDQGGRIDARR